MSYHLKKIDKGILGEVSKIREEFEELVDAIEQDNKIMQMCELSDMIGAIEAFAEKFNLTLDDLIRMKEATKGAFISGHRK